MSHQWRKEDGHSTTSTLESPSEGESSVTSIWQEKRGLVFMCFDNSLILLITLFFSVTMGYLIC